MSVAVTEAVAAAIRTVLRDTGRDVKSIAPDSLLAADLSIDSLDLAQTIVLLERSLGVDPFRSPSPVRPVVRTVSDLVDIYQRALPQ
ncbi:MAG: acyl carrier protein [Planctomycetia bacterium]